MTGTWLVVKSLVAQPAGTSPAAVRSQIGAALAVEVARACYAINALIHLLRCANDNVQYGSASS
eukprot:6198630-Pleurochrysis_carterae.AAC.4